MITKPTSNRFLPILVSLLVAVVLGACSDIDEPLKDREQASLGTRSLQQPQADVLTEAEALRYASQSLQREGIKTGSYTVEYITLSDKSFRKHFPSDTIAYVIHFRNNQGFAVIANDARSYPVVAYGNSDDIDVVDGIIKDPFLKSLETSLIKRNSNLAKENEDKFRACGVDHFHHYIKRSIAARVHSGDPFNQYVLRDHPGCDTGCVPTCGAVLVANTRNSLIYRGFEFDFKKINYCINQGPGFGPYFPPINTLIDRDIYMTFFYSYEGGVAAMSTLINGLGKDMQTDYNPNNSVTEMPNARNALKNLGCSISDLKEYYDSSEVWSLLYDGYMVLVSAEDENANKTCFIVIGGENVYLPGGSPEEADILSFTIYWADADKDGSDVNKYVSYSDEMINNQYYNFTSFFGVKIQK